MKLIRNVNKKKSSNSKSWSFSFALEKVKSFYYE